MRSFRERMLRDALPSLSLSLHSEQETVLVTMRDGVKLATDIDKPVGSTEKLPVLQGFKMSW